MVLFPITDEMRAIFKEHYNTNDPESIEQVLIVLRAKDVSQMQTVRLLMDELDMKLDEANGIVLKSRAWNT